MEHIPDHELIMDADGELDARRAAEVRDHLSPCMHCRRRQEEIVRSLLAVSQPYLEQELPPAAGPRARLAAALRPPRRERYLALGALAAALALMLYPLLPERDNPAIPRASLTPGAVRTVNLQTMCAAADEGDRPAITPAVAHEVFNRYGIEDPRPRAYEVDYLIPPDLGGSGEVQNLWPQSYSESVWNARVKDALEDRLRTMVCGGGIDLATAQHEIASDWVAAYKRHFRTNQPLPDHLAFIKDQPWE